MALDSLPTNLPTQKISGSPGRRHVPDVEGEPRHSSHSSRDNRCAADAISGITKSLLHDVEQATAMRLPLDLSRVWTRLVSQWWYPCRSMTWRQSVKRGLMHARFSVPYLNVGSGCRAWRTAAPTAVDARKRTWRSSPANHPCSGGR